MTSCAFTSCYESESCSLVGGCTRRRFGSAESWATNTKLKAMNGTKPARTNRDPSFIKRPRKAITK